MDSVALLIQLLAKTLFLAMPFGVTWLAFRRLALSESANSWLYAGCGLFAAFTTAGLAPWAFGLTDVSWIFFLFAALCPPIWLVVVLICGFGRSENYDASEDDITDHVVAFSPNKRRPPPLILEHPEWPDAPKPIFRHTPDAPIANENAAIGDAPDAAVFGNTLRAIVPVPDTAVPRSLLSIARDMRRNEDSRKHRKPLLLPPPLEAGDLPHLPFLKPSDN